MEEEIVQKNNDTILSIPIDKNKNNFHIFSIRYNL